VPLQNRISVDYNLLYREQLFHTSLGFCVDNRCNKDEVCCDKFLLEISLFYKIIISCIANKFGGGGHID